jgi:hypothetical protein
VGENRPCQAAAYYEIIVFFQIVTTVCPI